MARRMLKASPRFSDFEHSGEGSDHSQNRGRGSCGANGACATRSDKIRFCCRNARNAIHDHLADHHPSVQEPDMKTIAFSSSRRFVPGHLIRAGDANGLRAGQWAKNVLRSPRKWRSGGVAPQRIRWPFPATGAGGSPKLSKTRKVIAIEMQGHGRTAIQRPIGSNETSPTMRQRCWITSRSQART